MPIIKSALKKMRHDKQITQKRKAQLNKLKQILKGEKKKGSFAGYQKSQVLIDRAVQKQLIHKNKAARLKSRLSKLIKGKGKSRI